MAERKSPLTRKASGENIPEAQRGTVAIKLRVLAPVADELRRRATSRGLTLSAVVSALVVEAAR